LVSLKSLAGEQLPKDIFSVSWPLICGSVDSMSNCNNCYHKTFAIDAWQGCVVLA
jgi:hypothetical protein